MRARARAGGFALWVCFCLLCAGQDGGGFGGSTYYPSPLQVRTLSGTVVNSVTGEPIPGALVRVFWNPPIVAMTGPDGRFELQNVPASATLSIGAEKPGFGMTNSGMQMRMIGAGENNITIKLTPQGGIQGRILDDQGQPLEGIQVQAIGEEIVAGRKQVHPVSSTGTDENGAYEIDGLQPGNYLVKTRLHRLYWTNAPLAAAQQAYPGEYYPNAPDRSAAQPIPVMPGQTAEADFSLTPIQTYRISGVLERAAGEMGSLMLKRPDGDALALPRRMNRQTGQFTLLSVPAGSYKLEFRTFPRDGSNPAYAEQQLNVDADINGLQVVPQPLANVTVNIVRPPDPETNRGLPSNSPTTVQVQLMAPDESNTRYSANVQSSSTTGAREVHGVAPGNYRVIVHTFGSECLDSVTSGSTDLSSQNLTVSPGVAPQPITVTLRKDCATLGGTVRTNGATVPADVLLVPESGAGEPKTMHVVGANAQFSIAGLRPGGYHVYAFSTLDGLEYANPDVLRDFDAQEITLSANENANVTLDLIVRGQQ